MSHDPAGCPRSYCPECDAYGDGYSAGKTKAFSEVVGYLYDPSRDSVVAARVGMREPEVTAWGDARPLAIEREVGAWDLTPTDDGIVLDEHDVEVEVPPVVARRLRAEAQKRPGEIIVVYEVRDYSHDIPTSTTTPSRRLQVLEDEPGDETTGWFTLEAGYAGGSGGRRETPDLREVPQRVEAVGGEGDQGREAEEGGRSQSANCGARRGRPPHTVLHRCRRSWSFRSVPKLDDGSAGYEGAHGRGRRGGYQRPCPRVRRSGSGRRLLGVAPDHQRDQARAGVGTPAAPAAAPAAMQETRRGAAVYRVQRGDRR